MLLISSDSPHGHWPLGRVIEVYLSKDGHVRSALAKSNISDQLLNSVRWSWDKIKRLELIMWNMIRRGRMYRRHLTFTV